MGIGLRVKVIDLFAEETIYDLSFMATKTFLENSDRVMRSDASTVCEMTYIIKEFSKCGR